MSKSSDRHSHRKSSTAAASASGPEDDVGRHDVDARGDRPGVQVMDVGDARRVEDVGPDVVHVDALRGGLEEDVDGVAEQASRSAAGSAAR